MHSHSHHTHDHSPHQASAEDRIGLAFLLNFSFAIIEFIGGLLTNSTAIMADAVHDVGDSLSLGSAWLLQRWGGKAADTQFTYGYRRLSLFGAFVNSVVLVAGSIWVLITALPRLLDPVMPVTEGMIGLAIVGIAVNGYAAMRLSGGKTLNEKVLNWHLMEDVLGWIAVLIVAIVMQFVHWPILDPLLSIGFTLFILFNVARNFWVTLKLFFQAVPDEQLLAQVRESILGVDHVVGVHHLHLWSLDGEHHVLTAHVQVDEPAHFSAYATIKTLLHEALLPHGLAHTTIEIELAEEVCRDRFP